MAVVRVEIREMDGSSAVGDTQDATPEQIIAARELILDITRNTALPEPATTV